MQIHELNNFNGDLDSGAFFVVDDGTDTGRVSAEQVLAGINSEIDQLDHDLNARIDNIIAGGAAPSAAEIIDARLGTSRLGSKTYASLGDAIRGQADDIIEAALLKELSKTITAYGTYRFYVYAKKGDLITVGTDHSTDSDRITVYYIDGTNSGVKQYTQNGGSYARFIAEKDVERVNIYAADNTQRTITVTVEQTSIPISNYYDKTAKQSGYIDKGTGSVIPGNYYHSDYIPFAVGNVAYYSGYPSTFGTPSLLLFDKEKKFLGNMGSVSVGDGIYRSTLNWARVGDNIQCAAVAYCAFNIAVSGADTAVFYIDNIPDTNLEFGQIQPDPNEFFNAQQKAYIANAGSVPISGKKIAYNGDSICESRLGSGNSANGGAYAKMIADLTGGTYDNRGRGGGTLASGTGATRQVVNDVSNMPDDADLICFEGGINDYWLNVPLGTYSESDYSSTPDITTICGALESIFRQATQKWVGKPICFVIVHKIKSTVYIANSAGYTFAEAREKMIGICKKYAIPYYDAFAESGLNAYNDIQNTNFLTSNSSGTPDGCHPNAAGYEKYYVPQLITLFNSIMPRS